MSRRQFLSTSNEIVLMSHMMHCHIPSKYIRITEVAYTRLCHGQYIQGTVAHHCPNRVYTIQNSLTECDQLTGGYFLEFCFTKHVVQYYNVSSICVLSTSSNSWGLKYGFRAHHAIQNDKFLTVRCISPMTSSNTYKPVNNSPCGHCIICQFQSD